MGGSEGGEVIQSNDWLFLNKKENEKNELISCS